MKNCLKGLSVLALSLLVSITGVNANTTATAKINTSACETVYTNYYFFLEAETDSYMTTNNPRTMRHANIATYKNHFYSTNFNQNNVGYGQIDVSRNSYDSVDGITSMSLQTFYKNVLRASESANGSYSYGNSNYFFIHDWYKFVNGTPENGGNSLSIRNFGYNQLVNATMDADTEMVRIDSIRYQRNSTFSVEVTRSNYRNFGNTPVRINGKNWYLHPAVYYVQYCSEKASATLRYVRYYSNGENVTNMPYTETFREYGKAYVSDKTPVRAGYKFNGWNTRANGNGVRYYAGEVLYSDIDLYAQWIPDTTATYSIVYYSNTNDTVTNMPSTQTFVQGTSATISTLTPARKGYTFVNWKTSNGVVYKAGETVSKDLTLYAEWKKNDTNNSGTLPDNPKTGVEDYILPFGGVTLAALAGVVGLKKKKSFLQF